MGGVVSARRHLRPVGEGNGGCAESTVGRAAPAPPRAYRMTLFSQVTSNELRAAILEWAHSRSDASGTTLLVSHRMLIHRPPLHGRVARLDVPGFVDEQECH